MAAPTQDIGHPDLSWGTWGQGLLTQWYETAPDLIWPQSVVTYGRMRNDPQIKAVLGAYIHPLMRATWVIDPDGCRDEVVKHVADDLGVGILGTELKPGPARRRGIIWTRHLRDALSYLTFGHSVFERRYEIVGSGPGSVHLASLGPRTQWTIANMHVADDGSLDYIEQTTQRPPIPGSHLAWYVNDQEGSNWAGTSMLRAAFGAWLLKQETWRVHATSIRRFGMGVPIVSAPAGATQQQVIQAQQLASSMRGGDQTGIGLPQGFQVALQGVTGSVPDALGFIRYLDIAMAKMVHAGLIELGQTDNGSRALGETYMDMFQLAVQSVADQIATTATSGYPGLPGIITDIVDQNWGEDEPAPRLVCTDVGENYEVSADAIQSLVMSGAMTPDPALDEWVRKQWRMPERSDKWTPSSRGLPAGTSISPKAEQDSGNAPAAPTGPARPGGARPAAPAAPGGAPSQRSQAPAAGARVKASLYDAAALSGSRLVAATRKQQAYIDASSWEPTQHQNDWEQALAHLLLQYRAVMSAQRSDLVDRVINAMEAGGNASTLVMAAPEVGEGPTMITGAMVQVARRAAQSMIDEALRQGVAIDLEQVRIDADTLGGTAQARALYYSGWMAQQATAKALQVYGPTPKGYIQAADEVSRFLDSLSDDTVKAQLGAALTAAQNHGRFAVLEAAPESAGTAKYVAAEYLDKNTCERCRKEDGAEFDTIEAAQEAYPTGGYSECEGLLRCRGTVVAVWGGNEPGTDQGTGYLNLAAKAGGADPKAPGADTRSEPGPDDCYRTADRTVVHGPGCSCAAAEHGAVCACIRPVIAVGPKGYIHGWIYVGPQAVGSKVFHPQHGHGTVTKIEDGHAHVLFDHGTHTFEHKPADTSNPRLEARQEPLKTDSPEADVLAALKAGQASGVKGSDEPSAGQTADTAIVRFNDGTAMVRKRFQGYATEEVPKEIVGSMISKIVGAGAPTVVRDPKDKNVIWQPFVEAQTPLQRLFSGVPGANKFPETGPYALKPLLNSPEGKKIGLLDRIIGNGDRHRENWLVKDGKPVPIDHGGSFNREISTDIVLSEFAKTHPLTAQDAKELPGIRAKIAALKLSDPQEENLRDIALANVDDMIKAASQ